MYTTLNKLKAANLKCEKGWNALNKYLGNAVDGGTPISMLQIYQALGTMAAIRCLAALDGAKKEKQEFTEFLSDGHTLEEITTKFLELFGD